MGGQPREDNVLIRGAAKKLQKKILPRTARKHSCLRVKGSVCGDLLCQRTPIPHCCCANPLWLFPPRSTLARSRAEANQSRREARTREACSTCPPPPPPPETKHWNFQIRVGMELGEERLWNESGVLYYVYTSIMQLSFWTEHLKIITGRGGFRCF